MSKRCMGCMELFGEEFDICPHCGYIVGTPAEEAIHMEPGTLLYDRYIVGKVLGYGGFGVTYLGWDGKLEQKVAIKEYLPSEFSTRMPGQSQVTVFGGNKSDQFRDGMHKFVEEAKHLAAFQNESGIVKIFDAFEENDTAYIIMEYLEGETLADRLKREKTIPEEEAVRMIMPILESLQVVHEVGLLHRDIAPDNIFLTKSGEVKLIDFGASRYATTSHSRSLSVIIKPGYSPEEQYRSRGDQGPYTDVYAVAATLYKMVTGVTPPDAMERRAKYENENKEILVDPHKHNKKISVNLENAILNAMNVRIEDRTPNVMEFIKELRSDPPAKRRYGKIKKLNFYRLPLWVKISAPIMLVMILTFSTLLLTGVIDFSNFSEEMIIPPNVVSAPELEGLYKDDAIKQTASLNLIAKTQGTVESEYVPAGKIVLQTPIGGTYLNINDTILLTVSSGRGVISSDDGISTVPYVTWDTLDIARDKLKQAGLGEPIVQEEYDDTVTEGQIISQSLEAGQKVDGNTEITLVVSLGPRPFAMPDLIGRNIDEVKQELDGLGIVTKIEYKTDDTVPENQILSQNIDAGTEVKQGTEVTVTVSSGREIVMLQDVTGMPSSEAQKVLEDLGFHVTVLKNYSNSVPEGKVVSQDPQGGTNQNPGSDVTIYVSKGKKATAGTWSDWVDKLPSSVNSNGYEIQEQTLYRYRTQKTTTAKTDSLAGWELYDSSKANGNYGPWSGWSQNSVAGSGTREVEQRTQFRYRELETMTSSDSSLAGWELYDTTYHSGDFGGWSNWSEAPVSSDSKREVETKTQYRVRTKSTTTSTDANLSGWTQYGTPSVEYGQWIDQGWTANKPVQSDTVQISNTKTVTDRAGYTMYKYYHYWGIGDDKQYWNSYGNGVWKNYETVETNQELKPYKVFDGHQSYRGKFSGKHGSIWWPDSSWGVPAQTHEEWFWQQRTATNVYNYYQWSSWGDWTDTPANASDKQEVETRTLYRYRDRGETPEYHYRRWGAWSDWTTENMQATDTKEVESTQFYRYRDKTTEVTYYFRRWSDWTQYSTSAAYPSDTQEVQTKTQYRYRTKG